MSAADKLKSLQFGGTEDDAELCSMGKADLLILRDVVPELLAVVQAAEVVSEVERTGTLPDFLPLAVALASLDEALP